MSSIEKPVESLAIPAEADIEPSAQSVGNAFERASLEVLRGAPLDPTNFRTTNSGARTEVELPETVSMS